MKALLLIAHGSRVTSSNDEVRNLIPQLKSVAQSKFDFVKCAFLELAYPSIPQGVQQCIDAGAKEVLALPYFLVAGRHVIEDIPAELQKKREEYPDIEIRMCDYLGKSKFMPDLLSELVEKYFAR